MTQGCALLLNVQEQHAVRLQVLRLSERTLDFIMVGGKEDRSLEMGDSAPLRRIRSKKIKLMDKGEHK
jgi:hypothetical protein